MKKPKLRAAAKREVGGFQKRGLALLNLVGDNDEKEALAGTCGTLFLRECLCCCVEALIAQGWPDRQLARLYFNIEPTQ